MWASKSPSKDQKEDQNELISKGQDKQTSDQIKQMSKDQKDQMSEDWNKQPLIHVCTKKEARTKMKKNKLDILVRTDTNKQRPNQISKIPNKQEPKQDYNIQATTKTNKWRTNKKKTNQFKKH